MQARTIRVDKARRCAWPSIRYS